MKENGALLPPGHKRGRWLPELLALGAYLALLGWVLSAHEPWSDEAQAWLMARDLSLPDLVFHWMRYEGHLPLWHLLLCIPAKLGVPYEWGLKGVNFLCAAAAATVLLWKAPFPRWVRLVLPFTYFLFYQYGVLSRCYALFLLALWLSAAAWPARREHPWRLAAALAFLGGTTAYGMLIAFAAALFWFSQIARSLRREPGSFMPRLLRDRRVWALAALAAVHGLYVVILWPPADSYNPLSAAHLSGIGQLNAVLCAPLEATFFDVQSIVPTMMTPLWGLYALSALLVGALLAFLYTRRKLLLGALTLGLLMGFFLLAYYSPHHSGVLTATAVFLLWVALTAEEGAPPPRRLITLPQDSRRTLALLPKVFVAAVLLVQIGWSAQASWNDLSQPYDSGRAEAAFLRQHSMDQYRVYGTCETYADGDEALLLFPNSVLPYFQKNIFENFNGGRGGWAFNTHRAQPVAQGRQGMVFLDDPPDIVVANQIGLVPFHDVLPVERYVRVAAFYGGHFWKGEAGQLLAPQSSVYVRDDLLVRFSGLSPVADPDLERYKRMTQPKN